MRRRAAGSCGFGGTADSDGAAISHTSVTPSGVIRRPRARGAVARPVRIPVMGVAYPAWEARGRPRQSRVENACGVRRRDL